MSTPPNIPKTTVGANTPSDAFPNGTVGSTPTSAPNTGTSKGQGTLTDTLADVPATSTSPPGKEAAPRTPLGGTNKKLVFKDTSLEQALLRLEQWVIFTVLIALLPIALNYVRLDATPPPSCPTEQQKSASQTNCSKTSVDINDLIAAHGDLTLICAAITAEAIGEMFMCRKAKDAGQLFAFGMCCIIFFLSSGIFVRAVSSSPDIVSLGRYSIGMFIGTLLAGGSCKFYVAQAEAEGKEL